MLAVNKEFEEERKEGRRPRPISSSAIPSKGREGERERGKFHSKTGRYQRKKGNVGGRINTQYARESTQMKVP